MKHSFLALTAALSLAAAGSGALALDARKLIPIDHPSHPDYVNPNKPKPAPSPKPEPKPEKPQSKKATHVQNTQDWGGSIQYGRLNLIPQFDPEDLPDPQGLPPEAIQLLFPKRMPTREEVERQLNSPGINSL